MALQKQPVTLNFSSGLDTKTDPNQIQMGKFLELENSVFDKIGRLTKRNGFGYLPSLPDSSSSFLTTFNGNLTAIGRSLRALSQGAGVWVNKGQVQPLSLSTLPLIRNSFNQSSVDTAISDNGLVCTAYTENQSIGSVTTAVYRYAVADQATGQNIVSPTTIISSIGTVTYAPKVFSLGQNFIVVFGTQSTPSAYHLQYISINQSNPQTVSSASDINTSYAPASTGSFDGVVANNSLYLSYNIVGSSMKTTALNQYLTQSGEFTISSNSGAVVSVTADNTQSTPVIWTSFFSANSNSGYVVATNPGLSTLFSSVKFYSSASGNSVLNIASSAQNGIATIYYDNINAYPYASTIPTDFITSKNVNQTGSLSASSVVARSVGLASKAFLMNSTSYFLSSYQSPYQSTYFLLNSTGGVVSKLAYANGGGYVTTGLPSVSISSTTASVGYLVKDLIQAVNKDTNVAAGTQVNGIYSQTGVNLASFTFGTQNVTTSEIGSNLHLNGGFLWAYDGYQPVEHNFHLFPEGVQVQAAANASSGSMVADTYYYQALYEWSDNQGSMFRSAPSIPQTFVVSSGTASVRINVGTNRLTYKTKNPIKIVIYRWSANQPVYYQVTSINVPIVNNTTIDSVAYDDGNANASILGNNILYTNGGVVEDIGAPAFDAITLFDSRLWGITSEDKNLLWYSKQVIENTPVEMSDLFTLYVAPNAAAQGNTGPMTSIAPMDDKLIIFKKNAIYYLNGTGPDNTGANNQYGQPTFITSTVGCTKQNSIVLIPNGLMFQSDKGIWLLGRDLSTSYIGKEVEEFNSDTVLSALTVPGTNQVRFTMLSGATLMFDYFVGQWGTFYGAPGVSSALYNNLHTFIGAQGQTYQETPGLYLDGASPVLMSFKTGFINLSGLQGYKRVYKMLMLGEYKSPHRLTLGIAYDYDESVYQLASITPDNYSGTWGSSSSWGSVSTWGGSTKREQWELGFIQQQCQSFQVSFNEYYDSTIGVAPGAGLTLSGFTIVAGIKGASAGDIPARHKTS